MTTEAEAGAMRPQPQMPATPRAEEAGRSLPGTLQSERALRHRGFSPVRPKWGFWSLELWEHVWGCHPQDCRDWLGRQDTHSTRGTCLSY